MDKLRCILHCDLNSFYASAELLHYPQLRNKPVAVCGNPKNRHGIILAKNEPAKKFNIQTAETVWQAKRKCPDLILLPPHHDLYKKYSRMINKIYYEFTDLVEPFSIDESWLDITGSMHLFGNNGRVVGDLVRKTVKERTGLTISVGVSWNKIFAKMGSDYKKPDAVTVITPDNYKKILWPLPVQDMIFVGKSAAKKLKNAGIHTIGNLAAHDPNKLKELLGKNGVILHRYANGLDTAPVKGAADQREIKSVGHGRTFEHDLSSYEEVRQALYPLAEAVSFRLKQTGMRCNAVQIVIRDPDFHTISRQKAVAISTNLVKDIYETACALISESWTFHKKIRMLTITGIQLESTEKPVEEQISFFHTERYGEHAKQQKVESVVEDLKKRFGDEMITNGFKIKTHR